MSSRILRTVALFPLRRLASSAESGDVKGAVGSVAFGFLGPARPPRRFLYFYISLRGLMKTRVVPFFVRFGFSRAATLLLAALLLAGPVLAQAGNSPWENAVNVLQTAFTSTIARGLSLVAIVVSGLTFAFGEGGSKRVLAGVLFGVGMAIAAVNFLAWLFPG